MLFCRTKNLRQVLAVLLLICGAAPHASGQETNKQVCLSAIGMGWTSSEEAQRHLVNIAKREAVAELFGEMIWSMSEVKDLMLTRDEMQSSSAGLIRMRGTPRFSNGASFGDVCVVAELYVLKEDVQRLQPRTVRKKVCVADPRLSSGELRQLAERQAQVQAVQDFEPGLHRTDEDFVLRLLHEARIEEAGFIADTLTYCATASGRVYPIELVTATGHPGTSSKQTTATTRVSSDVAPPKAASHVHIVYQPRTAERASEIASRLTTLGFDVSTVESPETSGGPRFRRSGETTGDSLGNRLYHHVAEKEAARKIQADLRQLVALRLLPSSDPNRLTFTLWIIE